MRSRRGFITLLAGSATGWPLAAGAQRPAMPVIGFLSSASLEGHENGVAAFRKGLAEAGYVEGRNVAVEYRWAEGASERLPKLAADLVSRRVAVIVTPGSFPSALAARAATATIPIVYGGGADPVRAGLVASLNRPGGNVTGFVELNSEVVSKRLGFLHDLVPGTWRFAFLVEPNSSGLSVITNLQRAASASGLQIEPVVTEGTDQAIDATFASLAQKKLDALIASPSPLFYARRAQLTTLATRHVVPAIYWDRAFVEANGLMSYGSSVADMFRQVGIYAGRILKGEKPADMPVMQATKFELLINLKTAKALGLTVPDKLLAVAEEVIE
jgi:putative ABC transport system substrate-binding protein